MNAEANRNHIDVESHAVAIRPSNMAVGQALGVDEIIAQVRLIQEVMSKVMSEGEHYGKIPGCGEKKTLLQPGAQKLTMTFRLAPEYQIQEADLTRGHKEYRVICTLKSIQSGTFVGQGVGCCSTMESKYRWRSTGRKCPNCGKETIIKGRSEYGGGWLCFAKKGGCGAKWPDGAVEIELQSETKAEHDNPADFFNTVLKMAKKRAFVDATITATAASDIFTQDIMDDEEDADSHGGKDAPPPPPKKSAPAKNPQPKVATEKTRAWMLATMLKEFDEALLCTWAKERGIISPNQTLEDWPLAKVPTSRKDLQSLITDYEAWDLEPSSETSATDPKNLTPQSELAELITTAGFTFDQFQALVMDLGALKQECGSFYELPTERAQWCLKNSKAILSGLIKSATK